MTPNHKSKQKKLRKKGAKLLNFKVPPGTSKKIENLPVLKQLAIRIDYARRIMDGETEVSIYARHKDSLARSSSYALDEEFRSEFKSAQENGPFSVRKFGLSLDEETLRLKLLEVLMQQSPEDVAVVRELESDIHEILTGKGPVWRQKCAEMLDKLPLLDESLPGEELLHQAKLALSLSDLGKDTDDTTE